MKRSVLFSAMGVLAACGVTAQAQEAGRVISSTPVIQQVAVPRQVCTNQPMAVQQPNSGAGAVLGGIAGGAVGNQIGHGSGRAAATVIGLVGGALLGNNIEGRGQQIQNVQQCSTQTTYENRTVGYDVRYEYAGREYSVQMPYDPGPTIRVQVTPISANDQAPPQFAPAPGAEQGVPILSQGSPGSPQASAGSPVYTVPSPYPVYPVYPAAYPAPYYYPPVGISLGFGFYGGGHHRHWR